jgi:hypothetical protein
MALQTEAVQSRQSDRKNRQSSGDLRPALGKLKAVVVRTNTRRSRDIYPSNQQKEISTQSGLGIVVSSKAVNTRGKNTNPDGVNTRGKNTNPDGVNKTARSVKDPFVLPEPSRSENPS